MDDVTAASTAPHSPQHARREVRLDAAPAVGTEQVERDDGEEREDGTAGECADHGLLRSRSTRAMPGRPSSVPTRYSRSDNRSSAVRGLIGVGL